MTPSSLTFMNTDMQSVRLTALDIDHDTYGYTTSREVIFTAAGYLSQRVIVTIEGEVGGIGFGLSEDVISVTEGNTSTVAVTVTGTTVSTAIVTAKVEKVETDTGAGIQLPQFDGDEVTLGRLQSEGLVVTVARDAVDMGDRISTITLSAVGYDPAVLRVEIRESLVPVVSITSFEGNDSIQVSETVGSVTLRLTVSPPTTRALSVNLSYIDDSGLLATGASTVVVVSSNTMTHPFTVPIINDEIAAQPDRNIMISVVTGEGYIASTVPVRVNVMDDDVATVSISSVRDRVTEGDTIVFTVTRDLATDQATSITLTLTHNGDFFSPAMDPLILGEHADITLNLIGRYKRDGKVYYYLDSNPNNFADDQDRINHNLLDDLLNGGEDTVDTPPNRHNGSDDERSVIIDGYALVLLTAQEMLTFFDNNEVPDGWTDSGAYWSATPEGTGQHLIVGLVDGDPLRGAPEIADTTDFNVFFQVLTAQRTIVVDFPASQTTMGTVTVEVATIDTDDSTIDGSLIAELIAATSSIELGSTVSEVEIRHDNFRVTVTDRDRERDRESVISVDENSSATLVINVDRPVPDLRNLNVNLSYTNITGTPETISITVPAGSTSQSFLVFVGDDDIAAQPTRTFDVSLEQGDGYVMRTPSFVRINVLNNDSAVVSISAESDPVTEGNPALFEVQVDKEIATSLIVSIELETTGGDFGINLDNVNNVVIAAGKTTALLTVATGNDIDEPDGFLTARILSLAPQVPVSGVEPAISATDLSATVTISDDDDAVVVSITTLENEASTTISEADNEIMLLLKLSRSINQPLQVNLSSVGAPGLASGVPSPVNVPANRMTQQFTVSDIDDLIVAQPDRNIRISVITRAGYTASTVSTSVIVNVIDDDTATVTISPVRSTITAGEDAEFEVVLGLVTAVNIDIGIDVEYGGVFITDRDRDPTTVTVLAGQTSALLTVQTMENTGIAENSSLVATLRVVSHRALEIGDLSSARVEINALNALSITATPVSVSLVEMEGGDSTQISVRVNRIPEGSSSVTVTINLPEGSGLNVIPSSLEFTGTETRTVTVEVPSDNRYIGDRNVMLTFAADDYAMATVTVNITEDDLQPIELMVVGSTELDLVRFASTEITVSVEVATTLNVETAGSVVLADGVVSRYDLTEGALSQQIQIRGDNVGEGTVTFTVGEGRTADTAVVTVMVSTPSLVITGVPTPINLVTQETTVVIVSVRAEAGEPDNVVLEATIDGTGVAEVRLQDRTNVGADTTARFIVTGLNVAGETTLTLTASHIDYEPPESIEVLVDVDLRSIELSADPSPLEIVSGMSAELTITATPTVTITIISDDDDTASVADSAFMLMGGAENSTEINVSGGSTGTATLMIEASMAGYTTETVTVSVEVLDPLFIEAEPATFVLTEGENIQINVNPNLIRDDVTTVTISIEATTGTTGLTVIPSSLELEFTDPTTQAVTVTAADDNDYTGDRDATLRLIATGYATATVPIRILDNDLEVTVTRPDGGSSISVDEGSNVELVINVDSPVPNRRDLDVNLSYTNITGTPETRFITVSASSTGQSFSIPAGDDGIAAQSTRTFSVLIEEDISYAVGAPSSVAVSVLNDDSAVVSILPPPDSIVEGQSALFEVQVSNEIATTLTATINLAITGGDFGINPGPGNTDVVIAAGNTTALLTVRTATDEIGEAYGSLTAEIVSLAPEVLVSGVQPTRSANNSSAMATILDDDLSVRITTLDDDDQANTTVSESDNEVSLRLVLSAAINRALPVNLSYAGDLGLLATDATTVVEVPIGNMSRNFSILVGNDDIAAQSTRVFNVLITPDINYAVGTPSSVAVSVLDNDTATVSILPVRDPITDPITEGNDVEFEVQVDKEIAVDLIVGIALETTGGDFGISSTANVVIDSDGTTALLMVMTDDDDIGEAYGSLTATIVSLDSQMPVSGPLMISANNSSAMATILDDDLIVSIITSDNIIQDSTTVSESDEVSLRLILSNAINRDLPVTLSYIDDSGLAPSAPTVVNVLEGNTSQDFSILVRDDEIAAQSTRNIVISVATGVGYAASTVPVTVNVIDNDIATVSISRVEDRVIEGDTIVFTITRDKATAQASSISLTLTHNGDFFSTARDTLNFGDREGIRLILINRHKRDGKVYYYLNHNNLNPAAEFGDRITHALLDNLLNGGNDTTDTQEPGRHDGSDDARSVIIDGYALILPTLTEIQAFRAAENFVAPNDWANSEFYWSATILPGSNDMHYRISLHNSDMASPGGDDVATDRSYVFFQVLTAQRTIIVDLPAGQMDVMVEVATIDTDDSITDGSLTAELIAVTSPIELGSTVSEVVILNNNLEVTVTGLNGESSVDVDEDSSVTLVLKVNSPVDQPRDVNLSYMNVISDAMETISITVPAGSTSQDFSIFVGGDEIAAQATRTFNVLIVPDISSYVVGASSSVAVSVLNEDSAVVSIVSLLTDSIEEGNPARFEVQVDNEIATSLTVGIALTTVGGDFGISPSSTVVVIVAGETTALLTVATGGDIDEVDGSLTAEIISLAPRVSVSGVQPEVGVNSAMVTILDNDLLLVSITTLEGEASTTISEADNEIMLLLKLSRSINQPLQVNLNSVGAPGLAGGVPSPVNVPANRMTQQFTVSDIDDLIVAQPDRNIRISVITRAGYTASTVPVTINVIDDDTATVSILPVRTPITAGEDAEFEVVLGLVTAVDIDVGINVEEFGGNFITDDDRVRTTVTVLAGERSTVLTVQTMENTRIVENSSLVATLEASPPPHPDLTIDTASSSATVIINALSLLSITATPTVLSLVEGNSTEISVSLSRIPAGSANVTVMINLQDDSELTVSSPLMTVLTFTDTRTQTVIVTAENDVNDEYMVPRSEMLRFTADDYSTATVTVNITDDDPQPVIDLNVTPTATATLNLVRFTSTEIEVSVAVDANVGVSVDGGVVKLIDSDDGSRVDSINLTLIGGTSTRIGIFGASVGDGEVEVTARGIGAGTGALQEIQTVSVTVSTPTLVITGVSSSDINLLTREETEFIVSVRAEAGEPDNVVLEAMIDGTGVAGVRLQDRTNVGADTTARFIVTGLNVAGETTLTLTASHIDYEPPESIEVSVDVDLRSIELSADPSPLEIVSGMSAELTITATPAVTITIISDDDDTASVADSAFMLMGGAENSTEINVSGGSTGTATLMIEASMAGYTTEIVTVSVEVLAPLFIAVSATTFDVTEGEGIQVNVNPNLIRDDVTTVTISIEATTGTTGLTVMPSSLEFTDPTMSQPVTVTATDDNDYTGDRNATLTLTATGYATETVTIRILDNDLVVTVTERDGGSLISVDEGSDVELVINVDRPVPDRRDLDVNLSYTNITGTPETTSIRMVAGSTSQDFSIFVGDDDIAAQATRTFSVTVESGDGYVMGSPSSVDIKVLNNDSAVVSILPPPDSIVEGQSALFEVQVSNEIATTLTATINLAITGGDFGINPGPGNTDVVIAAGNTTALLTVRTATDEIGEAYGSLTAEIVSLAPEVLVSGVQPTRSANNSSAMATILDDDLSVRITTLDDDDQANTTVSESDNEVSLRLVLSAAINRALPVNLSYAGDLGLLATDATTVVEVPIGNMSRNFSILVGNDDIAAQFTRVFNVLLEPDINYIIGTPSSVAVSVLDDDVATVSISAPDPAITAGEDAVFELTLDVEAAVAATVEVSYRHENAGPFLLEDSPTSVVVTFAAGVTSTRVAVATMVGAEATADGLLIAELIAVTSPIELGSTVTEIAIQHTNLMVTVTTSDRRSSISVGEDSGVNLVLNVEPSVPDLRPLDVNLSYMNVISGTTETMSITVLAGSTSQDFSIFVGNDDIAAQATRTFNVLITPDISYAVGTPSSVAVSVLDDDTATVSILSLLTDSIVEGAEAQFEVQVDKEIAVDLIVGIALETTGGDFGISSTANVVIAKSTTTALLTVDDGLMMRSEKRMVL